MYLYETHIHSKTASACAWNTPKEMVQAYKQAGYTGMILTDHFIKGNTRIPRDLDWVSRMHMYYDAYLEAKEEGDKLDFDVFFGLEHWYEKSKEMLVYGIDLDFLLAHPELNTADIYIFSDLIHEAGGILVHAHPHRIRAYIDPNFKPIYEVCDGIEVYNAADSIEINELGLKDAMALGKLMTSGGDVHSVNEKNIGKAGVAFARRIKNGRDFVQALRNGEGHIVVDGEIYPEILKSFSPGL